MYDRRTEGWWQQFTGSGIVGKHAGVKLRQLPSQVVSFAEFADAAGRVLSRDTGHNRPYGRNPYLGYDRVGQNPFPLFDPLDARLPAMERVLGVSASGRDRLYPLSMLEKAPVINDVVGELPLVVLEDERAVKAWLLTILRHEHARLFERRRIETEGMDVDQFVAREQTSPAYSTDLRRALQRLPEGHRAPLILQVLHGFSAREIGAILGISDGSVTTRLTRARQAMRRLLEGEQTTRKLTKT